MDKPWPILIVGVMLVILIPLLNFYTFYWRGRVIKLKFFALTKLKINIDDFTTSKFSKYGSFFVSDKKIGLFKIHYAIGKRELWYFTQRYDINSIPAVYGKSIIAQNCTLKNELFGRKVFDSQFALNDDWEFSESTGSEVIIFYPLPHFSEIKVLKKLISQWELKQVNSKIVK